MRQIVFDTETTGLNPEQGDRLVEIGAIELEDLVPTGQEFHCFINPEREVSEGAVRIHGLTTKFLADKPKFSEIAQDFVSFVKEADLVAHNASFDAGFLNHELQLCGFKPYETNRYIDTLNLARKIFPRGSNSLDALCKRYEIDISHRDFHGALKDAKLLAEVYLELKGGRQRHLAIELEADQTSQTENQNRVEMNRDQIHSTQKLKTHYTREPFVLKATKEELEAHKNAVQSLKSPIWHSSKTC